MGFLFLDTSSFVKLYVVETGLTWIRNYIKGNQVIISELTLAEAINVITRSFRDGKITQSDANNILTVINRQIPNYNIVPLRIREQLGNFSSLGFTIPAQLRLRTLDSIQLLASEISRSNILAQDPTAAFTFVSSDVKLLQVAQSQGFLTENPENYP